MSFCILYPNYTTLSEKRKNFTPDVRIPKMMALNTPNEDVSTLIGRCHWRSTCVGPGCVYPLVSTLERCAPIPKDRLQPLDLLQFTSAKPSYNEVHQSIQDNYLKNKNGIVL
jgi:hypothetical protein